MGNAAVAASRIATGLVNKGMDEGRAIRIANAEGDKLMRGRADGGPATAAMRIVRQKYDVGGGVSGGDIPWFERGEERSAAYGLNMGVGAGRNDKNNQTLGSSAYVLPADVVAG